MNFQSFSQITFAFKVTPQLLARGMVWAAVMGLIQRLVPARPPRACHRVGAAGIVMLPSVDAFSQK